MTKHEIISALYQDAAFKRICSNIAPPDYSGDLFHETIMYLLEMPEEKIKEAYQLNYLKFLFLKIASNQWNSKTSPFFKKYRHNEPTDEIQQFEINSESNWEDFEYDYNQLVSLIETEIDTIEDEYDRELVILYLTHEDYRKVSELVGIKYTSVRHAINQALKPIREKYEQLFNSVTYRDSQPRICTKRGDNHI